MLNSEEILHRSDFGIRIAGEASGSLWRAIFSGRLAELSRSAPSTPGDVDMTLVMKYYWRRAKRWWLGGASRTVSGANHSHARPLAR